MRDDLAVVILAGGEGSRIGGAKPLRTFHGERLIDRALGRARLWSDTIAVAVRTRAQVGPTDAELILDANVPGPLGGLISGLEFAMSERRDFVLAIPADMPFLPADLAEKLFVTMVDTACALAASGGQLHPVCGLWRSNSVAQAESYAASGRRSLKGLAELLGFATVEWQVQPVDPFFNINTSEELAEAARRGT